MDDKQKQFYAGLQAIKSAIETALADADIPKPNIQWSWHGGAMPSTVEFAVIANSKHQGRLHGR